MQKKNHGVWTNYGFDVRKKVEEEAEMGNGQSMCIVQAKDK